MLQKNTEKSRYEVLIDGAVVGFAEYKELSGSVLMPHTQIDTPHAGEGLGDQLAHFALEDIKAEARHVIPMCPFIAAYIHRHPEYVNLVDPQQRSMFHV